MPVLNEAGDIWDDDYSQSRNQLSDPLDLLVENIMDLARENPIDEARIFIKDRIEKDVIKPYVAALKRAKETIRAFNGLGMKGEVEQACWDAYQSSPEMKQINAAIGS